MRMNPLRALEAHGQSVWQDNLTRGQLRSGRLRQLIDEDGLSGVTSNPTIFQKAIGGSTDYDAAIATLAGEGKDPVAIADELMIADVRDAADLLRPIWERTSGRDGFVSVEVAARLARDTTRTIAEAHRLWDAVNRPNLMVKIPGTVEGVPAIRRCLADGLNINVTLLFALDHYEAVAHAFLEAIEARLARGQPVERSASVASFFVSRVDTIVDRTIDERLKTTSDPGVRAKLAGLRGAVAVANAKLAYARFREIFGPANDRFQRLAARGAQVQRPLWASTSMKDPTRRDVFYVEELIAPQTVTTMPAATLDAFRDHGVVRGDTALERLPEARATLQTLRDVGIDLDQLTDELEEEGIDLFADSDDLLVREVAEKVRQLSRGVRQTSR